MSGLSRVSYEMLSTQSTPSNYRPPSLHWGSRMWTSFLLAQCFEKLEWNPEGSDESTSSPHRLLRRLLHTRLLHGATATRTRFPVPVHSLKHMASRRPSP